MIEFDLITPDTLITSEKVAMVTLPAEAGIVGILENHAPFASTLKPGIIKLHRADGAIVKSYFVKEGFVNVTGKRCAILAEDVEEKP